MNKIKVAFVDFWSHFDPDNFILIKALRENHIVEILQNPQEADYVFFSLFGEEHWFLPDRCVKIFYTGENVCPDFNACDYAVGFEWLTFGDRYLRLPNNYCTRLYAEGTLLMEKHKIPENPENRAFCSFVVSNADANPVRQLFFEQLSAYKKVDSGGRFMNNVGGPVADKIDFHRQHKFVIAFENSSHPGYTTEKIADAFAAGSIPIYWGDPKVSRVFNTKAFVEVKSVSEAIERVKNLDQDDAAYLQMLNEKPLANDNYSYAKCYESAISFMNAIVDQPHTSAYRHNREFWGRKYLDRERHMIHQAKKKPSIVKSFLQRIKSI